MKVQCGQCPAQYAVADERIRDKKVRIRCKRCNAAIVVDGKVTPPLVTSTPAPRSARPPSGTPTTESAPPASPDADARPSPRPVAHTIMGGLEAPVARQLVAEHVAQQGSSAPPSSARGDTDPWGWQPRSGMPEADRGLTEPPARGAADRWRVALTQQDLRWMTTHEITQAFRDGAVKSETFVFRSGMASWVTLLEVNEIAEALAAAQLVSPPLRAPRAPSVEHEESSRPSSPAPRRISSLPPPRKTTRQRDASGAESSEASTSQENASDSDESLPFALVSGRTNGAKKADPGPDAASVEPIAALDASLRDLAAREAARGEVAAQEVAARESSGAATPASPAALDVLQASAQPEEPTAATPAAAPKPPLEGATAPAAQAESSGGFWIWLLVVLLLVAAAVFYFRFSLGLP